MRNILLCLPLFYLPIICIAQNNNIPIAKPGYKYYNCGFTINVIDTPTIHNKKYVQINAVIFNNSQDTLRYGMEDFDFFYFNVISNNFLYIKNEPLRNIFIPVEVLPHKTSIHSLLLQARNNRLEGSIKVRFKLLLTRVHDIGPDMILTQDGNLVTLPAADVESRTHYINSNTIAF